jgi:mannose-6-phosphate isomerase-like protein (cupin superfamily)
VAVAVICTARAGTLKDEERGGAGLLAIPRRLRAREPGSPEARTDIDVGRVVPQPGSSIDDRSDESMSAQAAQREQNMAPGAPAGAPESIVRGPGEGHAIPGSEGITLKATAAETGGAIGFFEALSPPGFAAPRHIHHSSDELFYVLAGEFLFLVGERLVRAVPGTFVFIPRGTIHAPKVVGTEAGKVLSAFIPGGQEQAFGEFAQALPAGGGVPDLDVLQAIARKYDSEFVGPPL